MFGDTAVYYVETPLEGHEGKTAVGLCAYPKEWDVQADKLRLDSLVQVAFTGDETLSDYTNGVSMTCRSSSLLRVEEQRFEGSTVTTVLSDGKDNFYTHVLRYEPKSGVFCVQTEYENRSGETRTLEKLSTFSLSGLCALSRGGNNTCGLTLHRMTSAWSRECRLQSLPFSQIGMERSWARYGVKCERWGQTGSMPNRGYYPFAAVEDADAGVAWGVQMEAPYSWQFELCGEKEGVTLSGGLADYEFGHWRKKIPPHTKFLSHKAYFAVQNGLNAVCNALVHEADARLNVPASEEGMPVLFNEYCTTWGCPSEENIESILAELKGLPIGTFVIDAGWYKPEDKGWCNAVGDWRESRALFPAGMKRAVEKIHAAGMKAGVWFEFEVAGRDSECFGREDWLLKRDGFPITCKNRRFLNLRNPEVERYISEKTVRMLQRNGFEYLKIDYNDAYGIGCDGAESLGEGGRQVAEESVGWLDELRKAIPDLVIENCSSGGSRIEPLRMGKVSMCSFSDAHECAEIPLVAANVSRVIPARQMQIWAVLREGESDARTVYSLCAAMLGRICLSGDFVPLSPAKRALLREGLGFYDAAKNIVRNGDIVQIDCSVEYYRDPFGYQVYEKRYEGRTLLVMHNLNGARRIDYPVQGRLERAFTTEVCSLHDGLLSVEMRENSAGAFLMKDDPNG